MKTGDRAGARLGGQAQTIVAAMLGQLAQVMLRPAGQVLCKMTDVLVTVMSRCYHIELVGQFAFGAMKLADRPFELHG